MEIFPAIDIRGAKVVRLTKGDYDVMKVYRDDPTEVAKEFLVAGASTIYSKLFANASGVAWLVVGSTSLSMSFS